ncbi:MAG: hypothetical protein ACYCYF_11575 [Anaerolineae bacterium]
MSVRSALWARLAGAGSSEPLFVADLTGWHQSSLRRGTLPARLRGLPLSEIYRSLGLPIWDVVCPWAEQFAGLDVEDSVEEAVRTRTVDTGSGPLVWRWELGDDGAWRQTGFPVVGPADLPAAVVWARALTYSLDTAGITELEASIGSDGLLAIELPPRPLVQIASSLMGWERAPRLLGEPGVALIIEALDEHLQELVTTLAQLSPVVQLSPDDLHQSTVSAELFEDYLLPSYAASMQELGEYRKGLLVRTRGDISALADLLVRAGVTALSSVYPPTGEQSLGGLSQRLGDRVRLWGGIPGALLAPAVDRGAFEEAVRRIAADARRHSGILPGISGDVPLDADLSRLEAIPELIRTS